MHIIKKYLSKPLWLTAFLLSALVATGCSSNNNDSTMDTAKLTVISTNPADSKIDVEINRKVTATFSEPMDSASLNTNSFTVTDANESAINGVVTLDAASNTAIFAPGIPLPASAVIYTATITTAAESTTGKTMAADHVWTFTSGTTEDSTSPKVSSTDPVDSETAFYLNRNIYASFDEPLDPSTINDNSFTLKDNNGAAVSGVVSYDATSDVASFNPDTDLTAYINYTATLTTEVQDLAGIALVANFTWAFSGKDVATTLLPVKLGTAGDFAILAKTGISRTGTAGTKVTGDIGVSPEKLTAITGFSVTEAGTYATSDYVTGNIYAANMTDPTPAKMTKAVGDMQLAYTDAAGRTLPDFTELGAGNVTGMTLEPGLYKWGTNVLINDAGVTISGSADDVWIFQIANDLIVDNGAAITLAGGALPENIFWQVAGGTGVSIGTTAKFKGVVLAQKAIIVNTGASVDGRLLAQSAVTLDGNAVTQPVE